MLQRQEEQQTQTPALPPRTVVQAGTQRVTPDELTEALSVLEARRESEAKQIQNTLSIDEAVRDLGLDLTPDEVWQQVEAQRAAKARQEAGPPPKAPEAARPSPSGPALADTARETARVVAEQAQKLAVQATAVAQERLAASAAQWASEDQVRQAAVDRHTGWRERMVRPRRRGSWGATLGMIGLLALGFSWFSHGHGVTVNGDHQTITYRGAHKIGVVNGDRDMVTFRGECDTLVVNGDHDQIVVEGRVKTVITNGDGNTVRWSATANPSPPAIMNNGSGNQADSDSPDGP